MADVRMGQNCVSDICKNAWATLLELNKREEGGVQSCFLPGMLSADLLESFPRTTLKGMAGDILPP